MFYLCRVECGMWNRKKVLLNEELDRLQMVNETRLDTRIDKWFSLIEPVLLIPLGLQRKKDTKFTKFSCLDTQINPYF